MPKNELSKPGVLKRKRSLNPLISASPKETVVRSQLCGKTIFCFVLFGLFSLKLLLYWVFFCIIEVLQLLGIVFTTIKKTFCF